LLYDLPNELFGKIKMSYRMLLSIKTWMDVRLLSYKNWQGNIKAKLQL
jgi:hypothetical protein